MLDFANFVYAAASELSRSRAAAARHDRATLREAVGELRETSEAAGAERMALLCDALMTALGGRLRGPLTGKALDEIDARITAIADELDQVTGDLQVSRSA